MSSRDSKRPDSRLNGLPSTDCPPLHLQGRGTARSAVEGPSCRVARPLHHAPHGPLLPEIGGRIAVSRRDRGNFRLLRGCQTLFLSVYQPHKEACNNWYEVAG